MQIIRKALDIFKYFKSWEKRIACTNINDHAAFWLKFKTSNVVIHVYHCKIVKFVGNNSKKTETIMYISTRYHVQINLTHIPSASSPFSSMGKMYGNLLITLSCVNFVRHFAIFWLLIAIFGDIHRPRNRLMSVFPSRK